MFQSRVHSSNKELTIVHNIPALGFRYQVLVSGFSIDAEIVEVVAVDNGDIIRMAILGEALR